MIAIFKPRAARIYINSKRKTIAQIKADRNRTRTA